MTLFVPKTPLAELCRQLDQGETTSRALIETALDRIAADGGNGGAAFIEVNAADVRAQADAADALRRVGTRLSPLAGLPVSVKDLFDVKGQQTRAASKVLSDVAPAAEDAPTIARLRRACAVLIGRTNMSEFAFSGLGLNPHFGSPVSPWRAAERHVSGGSSSGAAVSVAHGMAAVGLGSDTGGSLRVPAAFCGLTGFKPTAHRIPTAGGIPLSTTLDCFGGIAPTVACCALFDRILAGVAPVLPAERPIAGARLAILTNVVLEGLDPAVAAAYEAALSRLSAAGALLTELPFTPFDTLGVVNRFGFSPIEAWWYHRQYVRDMAERYDARVLLRIKGGEAATAADYLDLLQARREIIAAAQTILGGFDAILMPTAPILPPRIADVENDQAAFFAANGKVLRNPSLINFLDGCALSLPIPGDHGDLDAAPVGLMVAGLRDTDDTVLSIGAAIEKTLAVHAH